MACVITASTLVGNELAHRCTAEVQGAGKHHRSAVARNVASNSCAAVLMPPASGRAGRATPPIIVAL